jgi:hypothetical protein
VVFFPQVSQLKPCMPLSSPPYVPHVLPIDSEASCDIS